MATPFQITIPEPCNADWASMTPEAKGRFCAACQKCVVDLTAKAPEEIRDIYHQHGGNVCGRVTVDQLSRPAPVRKASMQHLVGQATAQGWTKLRRFAFALLLAFGFFQAGQAQTTPHVKMGKIAVAPTPTRELSGTVHDEDGEPLSGARVVLANENGEVASTTTDRKGRYAITGRWRGTHSLTVSAEGLDFSTAHFDFSNYDDPETWHLQEDFYTVEHGRFMFGEIAVIEPEPEDPVLAQSPALVTGERYALSVSQFTFTAYPNPATDHLLLVTSVATRKSAQVRVYDLTGNLLEERTWNVMASPAHVIELNHRAAGTYFLHVSTSEQDVVVRRFVKL